MPEPKGVEKKQSGGTTGTVQGEAMGGKEGEKKRVKNEWGIHV